MSKQHSFNIEDAERFGVYKAVLLYNIRFWLDKAKANKSNINDGYYWTYNSSRAFSELFPYMKSGSIKNWLKELEEEGILLSGNFNARGYDRTKWYTIPSEYAVSEQDTPIALTVPSIAPQMQSNALTVQPIPDSKPYSNTDIDYIYSLYPTICPNRKQSNGKSKKNKVKIKELIKSGEYTAEKLSQIINRYVDDCKRDGSYMKNFSTFLNNIPDYDTSSPNDSPKSLLDIPSSERVKKIDLDSPLFLYK